MWCSSFCSEGPKNHLNSKILVSDFVPRGFEARRRWGFEAWNQGFRGTESGVSRHGIRGFEARNQGFRGAATLTEHLSASSFPAVPQGPIWRGGVSRGGGTNRTSVLYHFLLTVPKHWKWGPCPCRNIQETSGLWLELMYFSQLIHTKENIYWLCCVKGFFFCNV